MIIAHFVGSLPKKRMPMARPGRLAAWAGAYYARGIDAHPAGGYHTNIVRVCHVESVLMKRLTVIRAKRYGVFGCPPETSLLAAARQMTEESVGCLIVSDTDGAMAGIITRTDLLRAHMDTIDWATTPVSTYMTRHVFTVAPDDLLEQAIEIVLKEHIDRVVVADKQSQRPLAVVSTWDMVNTIMSSH